MVLYPKRKFVRRARKPYKKPTVKKMVRKAKISSFNSRVKSVLYKNAETKVINYSAYNRPVYNVASIDFDSSLLNLIPSTAGISDTMYTISQLDVQSGREGNMIQPTSISLSGVLRINNGFDLNTNYNPCPVRVCMWVFTLKKHLHDVTSTVSSVVDNSFFQNGATSVGFTGTTVDLTRFPNSQQITLIKKRVFTLGNAQYVSGFTTNGANNVAQQFANNDSNQSLMFRMKITPPKKLLYNDGTDTPVNARRIWLMFTTHRVDGAVSATSGGSFTGPIPVYLDLSAEFRYKDI